LSVASLGMVHWTIPFAAPTAPHPSERHENIGAAKKQDRCDIGPGHKKPFIENDHVTTHVDRVRATFESSSRGAVLFRLSSAGNGLATFHYNFNPPRSFPCRGCGSSFWLGYVSVRRSTKGYSHRDGRTGFGAPHVKPSVRPSTYPARPCVRPWKIGQILASRPAATKVYSPDPCAERTSRHICVHCRAPVRRCVKGGPAAFTL
jgi:hypothetical protein